MPDWRNCHDVCSYFVVFRAAKGYFGCHNTNCTRLPSCFCWTFQGEYPFCLAERLDVIISPSCSTDADNVYTVHFLAFTGHDWHPCWLAHWHNSTKFGQQIHFRWFDQTIILFREYCSNRVVFAWPWKLTCIVFGLSFLHSLIGQKRDFLIILTKNMAKAIMYCLYLYFLCFLIGSKSLLFEYCLTPSSAAKFTSNWMALGKNHVTAISTEICKYVTIHPNFASRPVWFEKMFLCCFFLKAGRKDLTNRPKGLSPQPKSFLPVFRKRRNIFSHHTGRLAKFGWILTYLNISVEMAVTWFLPGAIQLCFHFKFWRAVEKRSIHFILSSQEGRNLCFRLISAVA